MNRLSLISNFLVMALAATTPTIETINEPAPINVEIPDNTKVMYNETYMFYHKTSNGAALYATAEDVPEDYVITAIENSEIQPSMNEYEKAIAVNDYLKKTLTYDNNAALMTGQDKQYWKKDFAPFTDYCLLTHYAVCGGYTEAFQSMCKAMGIEVWYVTGYAANQYHAWNVFIADGKEYSIDVTWNDTETPDNLYVSEGQLNQHKELQRVKTYKISGDNFTTYQFNAMYKN